MSKVELLLEPHRGWHNATLGPKPAPIKRMLPYGRSRLGSYVHRVRSAMLYQKFDVTWDRGVQVRTSDHVTRTHIAIRYWCGVSMSGGTRGIDLFDVPPERAEVCATCEGRAVGAGMASTVLLAQRPVRFSPRRSG